MAGRRKLKHKFDEGIKHEVEILQAAGIETFESCQGGKGHTFPEATVTFHGGPTEGLKALHIALSNRLNAYNLRRVCGMSDGELTGPWWELTFFPLRKR
jgi:hypothetical protein